MELRHLRYFKTVAEELSFTRASALLHVAQSAVSAQIRDLENELGIALFERNSRQVQLTAAGKIFLSGTDQIFRTLEDTGRKLRRIGRVSVRTVDRNISCDRQSDSRTISRRSRSS